MTGIDRRTAISLRQSLPYLRLHAGKCFVVKIGGALFGRPALLRAFCEQVAMLHQLGIRVVLVHGGGPGIAELSRSLGAEVEMVAGRRVTDDLSLRAVIMALAGELRTTLLGHFRALEVPAVGVSGLDAGLIQAAKRPPVRVDGETVDYGWVGDVVALDRGLLDTLFERRFLPVVSPLAADATGQPLNLNADGVAAALARHLEAEKLIIASDQPGILRDLADPTSLVSWLDVRQLNDLVASGALSGGMRPKAAAVKDALYAGVPRVHLISHAEPEGLLREVFTTEGSGTLIVLDAEDLLPDEAQPKPRSAHILEAKKEA